MMQASVSSIPGGALAPGRLGRRLFPLLLGLPLLAAGCAGDASRLHDDPAAAAPRKQVLGKLESTPPFLSPAVRSGGLVFLSGQLGRRPGETALVPGGAAAEAEQALENIRGLLVGMDLELPDIVKCTVFLADMADYSAVNEVYRRFFPAEPPARSAVAVSGMALEARVEIECIAAAR
jgi:reactive intermediate/imine deaminase